MTNTAELKANNIRKCIEVILKQGRITKPQLAAETGLTAVTAHKFINELLERSLLREDGLSSDGVGKKAVYYTIDPAYAYIVGQNIYDDVLTTVVFDFDLRPIKKSVAGIPDVYSDEVLAIMCDEIKGVIGDIDVKKVCGVGITVSGQVDYRNGVVTNCVGMSQWDEIPLKRLMEDRLHIPIHVENDINAGVIALKWQNDIDENCVLIHITDGVGIGVWLDDDVFRGTNSYAGELAHVVVGRNGRKCRCGNYDCIETYVSDEEIYDAIGGTDIGPAANAALAGDEKLTALFTEKSEYIARIADIAIKAYDPGVLFISSRWLSRFPVLCTEVTDYIYRRAKWLTRNKTHIRIVELDADFMNLGAGYLVLDQYIRNWK